MSKFSFKQFVEFVSLEEDPTDDQINEIFGLFKNNDKLEKARAEREKLLQKRAQLKAEFDARRAARTKQQPQQGAQKTQDQRNGPSAAAAGKAAENDWVHGMLATNAVER